MMNQSQVRMIDPILSDHARGYIQPGHIGQGIFPRVPVGQYGGRVVEFGKEAFRRYNVKRSPGSDTKRIRFGHDGKPFAIVPGALEAVVPREWMKDATQVPGIDLAARAVNGQLRIMALDHECACADLALDVANYDADHKVTLVGADRWSSSTSDPSADIAAGQEAVRQSIGVRPNTLMLSSTVMSKIKFHPALLESFKYVQGGAITVEMLKTLWGFKKILIGESIVASGPADTLGDVWRSDVWMGYVNDSPSPNSEEPSFGYTYTIEGHPAVEEPYYEKNPKSWIYGVSDDNSPVLSGMAAGYLIKDAGLPAA